MCRNIKTLFNFEPPATEEEIVASSVQFVRKLSGFNAPSKANQAAFDLAVEQVSEAARTLIHSLVTVAPPRNREIERARATQCSALREGMSDSGGAGSRRVTGRSGWLEPACSCPARTASRPVRARVRGQGRAPLRACRVHHGLARRAACTVRHRLPRAHRRRDQGPQRACGAPVKEADARKSLGTGRGLLLVVDAEGERVRLEVARELEGVFVDSFVAFIEREQMAPFFAAGRVGDGIVAASELIVGRAEEAIKTSAPDGPARHWPAARVVARRPRRESARGYGRPARGGGRHQGARTSPLEAVMAYLTAAVSLQRRVVRSRSALGPDNDGRHGHSFPHEQVDNLVAGSGLPASARA